MEDQPRTEDGNPTSLPSMFNRRVIYRQILGLLGKNSGQAPLYYLLQNANPRSSLFERVIWLEQLMIWVRHSSIHVHDFDPKTGQLHNVRLRFMLHVLDRNPEWKRRTAETLRSLVAETSALTLFAHSGMGQQRGFLGELSDLLLRKILPRPAEEKDLFELFLRIFQDQHDAIWVSHIPSVMMGQIVSLLQLGSEAERPVFENWHRNIGEAIQVLGARVAALGTAPEIRQRLKNPAVRDSPFLKLNQALNQLVEEDAKAEIRLVTFERCKRLSEACRAEVQTIYIALETSGVSVGLVYQLENLTAATQRIDLLSRLLLSPSDDTPELLTHFLSTLIRDRLAQTTFSSLIRTNLHLLSRKIVERAGDSGKHYITRTRGEYFEMLREGMGGGVIMVFTTLAKFSISALHLPLFLEGLFFSINYSFSFVTLQLLGFTLATKQPAATASELAGKLNELEHQGEVRKFVDEACRMSRTQFAALLGNILLLVPIAAALDLGSFLMTKHHLLPHSAAEHVIDSLNPLTSVTIPMAAFTGVLLWLSSLAAGWFENWVVFHRLPEALATHRRLIQVFGRSGAKRIGDWSLAKASLFGGNISLGCLLGMVSIVGRFTGFPLDVRHVTLSSASLVFATCSLVGPGFDWKNLILPTLGIAAIGTLNFAVGYSLAFAVAARARDVSVHSVRRLLRGLRSRLRNRPRDFFLPPQA